MPPPRRKKGKFGYGQAPGKKQYGQKRYSREQPKESPGLKKLQDGLARAAAKGKLPKRAAREREEEKKASQTSDITRANLIQTTLLPEKIPTIKGYDIRVFYQSCQEIGGDYYDFLDIDDDHLGMIIADVSGKGVSGAMIMTMARAVIRLLAENNPDPVDTIIRANKNIARDIKNVMFLTILYVVLNTKTGDVEVVNAGHNPLIFWDGIESRLINPPGIAVGFDLGTVFNANLKSEKFTLSRGDRIVLYTDGVVESMNQWNEEFSEERFIEVVEEYGSQSSGEFINNLVNILNAHQGDAPQHDDITVVTLKFNG